VSRLCSAPRGIGRPEEVIGLVGDDCQHGGIGMDGASGGYVTPQVTVEAPKPRAYQVQHVHKCVEFAKYKRCNLRHDSPPVSVFPLSYTPSRQLSNRPLSGVAAQGKCPHT
jgi:hypothetical protein